MRVLREGSTDRGGAQDVVAWEEFLTGAGYYIKEVDGTFDYNTTEATLDFQRANGLKEDGVVGPKTWAKALNLGFHLEEDVDWPLPPADLHPLSAIDREQLWGKISYHYAPIPGNLERIVVNQTWGQEHLITVDFDFKIPGMLYQGERVGTGPGQVTIHKLVADSFLELWAAWRDRLLLPRVITWAGLYSPRFIRGSRTILSNHAYATAFDINAPWNGLRKTPALVGERGCVRELVQIANDLGWYWGGHFARKDGMHFEATEKAIRS